MAFNINAQVILSGPKNLKTITKKIQKDLKNVSANVNISLKGAKNRDLKNLNQTITRLSAGVNKLTTAISSLNSTVSKLPTTISKATAAQTKLVQKTAAANKSFAKTKKQIKETRSEIEKFGKDAALAVRRYGAFTVATGAIFGLTRAIQNALSQSIKFDRELVKISQITGKSSRDLNALKSSVNELATGLGLSGNELLKTARIFAQTGQSLNQIEKSLRAVAKASLAPTFGDMESTAEGVIAVLAQFEISASKTESVLGSLNAVAKKFAVESEDLISVIRRAGGVFAATTKSLGDPEERLRELIGIFTAVRSTTRESADTIAVGLRTIFTRIQRPTTIKFLQDLGIQLKATTEDAKKFGIVEGEFIGVFEALRRISQGIKGLDTLQLAKVVEELGGVRQVGKLIPALREFDKAERARQVALAGTSSLTKDVALATQTLSVQIEKTTQKFEALIRKVSESATFQSLARTILSTANAFLSLADTLTPLIPLLTVIVGKKLISGAASFGKGFFGGLKKQGGLESVGDRLGGIGTQKKSDKTTKSPSFKEVSTALKAVRVELVGLQKALYSNPMITGLKGATTELMGLQRTLSRNSAEVVKLAAAVTSNTAAMRTNRPSGGARPGGGRGKRGFAQGGMVPVAISTGEIVVSDPGEVSSNIGMLRKANKKSSGGSVDGLKSAFVAKGPGTGTSDSIKGTLPAGAFVINAESSNKILGRQNLQGGNLVKSREKTVGAAILEDTTAKLDKIPTIKKSQAEASRSFSSRKTEFEINKDFFNTRTFSLQKEGLSGPTRTNFMKALETNIIAAANNTAQSLAADLELTANAQKGIPQDAQSAFLKGINTGTRGNLFEDTLKVLVGPPFNDKPDDAFDFKTGLKQSLKDNYQSLAPLNFIDAKATEKRASKAEFIKKISNQIALDAISEGTQGTPPGLLPLTGRKRASRTTAEEVRKGKAAQQKKAAGGIIQRLQKGNKVSPLIYPLQEPVGQISSSGTASKNDAQFKTTVGKIREASNNSKLAPGKQSNYPAILKGKVDNLVLKPEPGKAFGQEKIIKKMFAAGDKEIRRQLNEFFRSKNQPSPKPTSLDNDQNAVRTMSGFIFEQFLTGITGASAEGGQAPFDFIVNKNKDIWQEYAEDEQIPKYVDAKRTFKDRPDILKKALRQRELMRGIKAKKKAGGGKLVPTSISDGESIVLDPKEVAKNTEMLQETNRSGREGLGQLKSLVEVKGKGTGTSDSNDMMLPEGSFVVKADSTKKSLKRAGGGPVGVQKLQGGGIAKVGGLLFGLQALQGLDFSSLEGAIGAFATLSFVLGDFGGSLSNLSGGLGKLNKRFSKFSKGLFLTRKEQEANLKILKDKRKRLSDERALRVGERSQTEGIDFDDAREKTRQDRLNNVGRKQPPRKRTASQRLRAGGPKRGLLGKFNVIRGKIPGGFAGRALAGGGAGLLASAALGGISNFATGGKKTAAGGFSGFEGSDFNKGLGNVTSALSDAAGAAAAASIAFGPIGGILAGITVGLISWAKNLRDQAVFDAFKKMEVAADGVSTSFAELEKKGINNVQALNKNTSQIDTFLSAQKGAIEATKEFGFSGKTTGSSVVNTFSSGVGIGSSIYNLFSGDLNRKVRRNENAQALKAFTAVPEEIITSAQSTFDKLAPKVFESLNLEELRGLEDVSSQEEYITKLKQASAGQAGLTAQVNNLEKQLKILDIGELQSFAKSVGDIGGDSASKRRELEGAAGEAAKKFQEQLATGTNRQTAANNALNLFKQRISKSGLSVNEQEKAINRATLSFGNLGDGLGKASLKAFQSAQALTKFQIATQKATDAVAVAVDQLVTGLNNAVGDLSISVDNAQKNFENFSSLSPQVIFDKLPNVFENRGKGRTLGELQGGARRLATATGIDSGKLEDIAEAGFATNKISEIFKSVSDELSNKIAREGGGTLNQGEFANKLKEALKEGVNFDKLSGPLKGSFEKVINSLVDTQVRRSGGEQATLTSDQVKNFLQITGDAANAQIEKFFEGLKSSEQALEKYNSLLATVINLENQRSKIIRQQAFAKIDRQSNFEDAFGATGGDPLAKAFDRLSKKFDVLGLGPAGGLNTGNIQDFARQLGDQQKKLEGDKAVLESSLADTGIDDKGRKSLEKAISDNNKKLQEVKEANEMLRQDTSLLASVNKNLTKIQEARMSQRQKAAGLIESLRNATSEKEQAEILGKAFQPQAALNRLIEADKAGGPSGLQIDDLISLIKNPEQTRAFAEAKGISPEKFQSLIDKAFDQGLARIAATAKKVAPGEGVSDADLKPLLEAMKIQFGLAGSEGAKRIKEQKDLAAGINVAQIEADTNAFSGQIRAANEALLKLNISLDKASERISETAKKFMESRDTSFLNPDAAKAAAKKARGGPVGKIRFTPVQNLELGGGVADLTSSKFLNELLTVVRTGVQNASGPSSKDRLPLTFGPQGDIPRIDFESIVKPLNKIEDVVSNKIVPLMRGTSGLTILKRILDFSTKSFDRIDSILAFMRGCGCWCKCQQQQQKDPQGKKVELEKVEELKPIAELPEKRAAAEIAGLRTDSFSGKNTGDFTLTAKQKAEREKRVKELMGDGLGEKFARQKVAQETRDKALRDARERRRKLGIPERRSGGMVPVNISNGEIVVSNPGEVAANRSFLTRANKFASGGAVGSLSSAFKVSGPGSGTSDSIKTMLPAGSFVINASSAQKLQRGGEVKVNEKILKFSRDWFKSKYGRRGLFGLNTRNLEDFKRIVYDKIKDIMNDRNYNYASTAEWKEIEKKFSNAFNKVFQDINDIYLQRLDQTGRDAVIDKKLNMLFSDSNREFPNLLSKVPSYSELMNRIREKKRKETIDGVRARATQRPPNGSLDAGLQVGILSAGTARPRPTGPGPAGTGSAGTGTAKPGPTGPGLDYKTRTPNYRSVAPPSEQYFGRRSRVSAISSGKPRQTNIASDPFWMYQENAYGSVGRTKNYEDYRRKRAAKRARALGRLKKRLIDRGVNFKSKNIFGSQRRGKFLDDRPADDLSGSFRIRTPDEALMMHLRAKMAPDPPAPAAPGRPPAGPGGAPPAGPGGAPPAGRKIITDTDVPTYAKKWLSGISRDTKKPLSQFPAGIESYGDLKSKLPSSDGSIPQRFVAFLAGKKRLPEFKTTAKFGTDEWRREFNTWKRHPGFKTTEEEGTPEWKKEFNRWKRLGGGNPLMNEDEEKRIYKAMQQGYFGSVLKNMAMADLRRKASEMSGFADDKAPGSTAKRFEDEKIQREFLSGKSLDEVLPGRKRAALDRRALAAGREQRLSKEMNEDIKEGKWNDAFKLWRQRGKMTKERAKRIREEALKKARESRRNSLASGGSVLGLNSAYVAKGPGTGTSDSIRTMLPEGAYVINRKSSDKIQGLRPGGAVKRLRPGGSTGGGMKMPDFSKIEQAFNNFNNSVGVFSDAVKDLNDFSSAATQLDSVAEKFAMAAEMLASLPELQVSLNANVGPLEVILNGTQLLANFRDEFITEVMGLVALQITDQFLPDGRRAWSLT